MRLRDRSRPSLLVLFRQGLGHARGLARRHWLGGQGLGAGVALFHVELKQSGYLECLPSSTSPPADRPMRAARLARPCNRHNRSCQLCSRSRGFARGVGRQGGPGNLRLPVARSPWLGSNMSDAIDEIELAVWRRRARRWTIGLAIQLTVNTALVALALGGFGADRPQIPASIADPPALPSQPPAGRPAPPTAHPVPTEEPTPTRPLAQQRELNIERPSIPATFEPAVADPPPAPPPPPPSPPLPDAPEVSVPEPAADWLLVANPANTGGPVHLAVDGVVFRLAPGEYCRFTTSRKHRVAY